ncbi:myophilin-like [Paramacrobiotus metropolitanus]|uniref:myophilin-like n=1 Tax=Paramacrobiotus metropolitanus TaxID=2943436 RepID=UPI002445CE37|nr:myophilin-like [Paramacrobiotus metropolitanus]
MANSGPTYGMSAAVARKLQGKRDTDQEAAALQWIYAILGERPPNTPYEDLLRDGQVLCRFANKIQPGVVPRINSGPGQFKLMENIAAFQQACKALGVRESDVFQTVDLWERRNLSQVTNCLSALGSVLQKTHPHLPMFGPRISEAAPREFTDEQMRAGDSYISLQYGTNQGANQSGQNFGNTRHM